MARSDKATDLINRYLNTIRWNLPRGVRADDIIAELGDVIASRIEDREEGLDRALTAGETSELLQDFGHPLIVAARYGRQQWLIGPEIFPFYWFSLKIVLALCVVVMIIAGVVHTLLAGADMPQALVKNVSRLPWALLGPAAIVTLIFAVIERTGWLTDHLRQWKPEQLPDLPDLRLRPKSAWNKAFEIAIGVAFLLWWTGVFDASMTSMTFVDGRLTRVEPTPVWDRFYWPILAIAAAHLIYNLIQLARPRWKAVQALIGTATTLASLALLAVLYQAGRLVTIMPGELDAVRQIEMQEKLDRAIHIVLLLAAAIWTWQWLAEMWRLSRARRG